MTKLFVLLLIVILLLSGLYVALATSGYFVQSWIVALLLVLAYAVAYRLLRWVGR